MSNEITPQEADEIMDLIAKGDFTKSRVAHNAEIPLLAYYLVLLSEKAASLYPGDPPGICLNNDSMWDFIRAATCYRIMVKTARHIGHCQRCRQYFRELEPDV